MACHSTVKANNTGSRARRKGRRKGAKKNRKHVPGKTTETMNGGKRYYSKVQREKKNKSREIENAKKHNFTTI